MTTVGNISQIQVGADSYNIGHSQSTSAILYGSVDSTSTSTVYTATIEGLTELVDGTCVMLHNGVVTSESGFTINLNGLGAKKCYNNMTLATQDTTIFNINYTMLFIYSSALDSNNGGWWCYRGYNSDNNTIGYQIRTNSTAMPTITRTRYYRLLFTSADNAHWVPANTGYDNSATSKKTVNQNAINPFGRIVYMTGTTNVNAGVNVGATVVWEQYTLNLGYSFNTTGTELSLTFPAPVFVKCAPQTNGSAIIDSTTPFVQTLPNIADNKIYIFLGMAYSATNIELQLKNSVYWHDGTALRLWTGKAETIYTAATAAPPAIASSSVTGSSTNYARQDHTHNIAVTTGDSNGQIKVAGINASVKGLGSAAYTASTAYLPSSTAIPTATSQLTNDSGFITDADIPEGAAKYTNVPQNIATIAATGVSNAFSPGDHVHAITKATITGVLGSMPTAATGITVSDHNTTTITGVQSSTTSVTGVQATTTTASKITTTTVTIPNVTNAGTASNWVFENITVPIKDTAKTVTGVTAAGSGSFTQGSFDGGSFVQGTDSFTTNVPTKIDTSKFNGGSYSHGGFSGGSFTQGTFNGGSGSFTQGSFSGGSLTMTIDETDTKKLNIVFTAATHGADSHTHTAATHGNDSFTAAVYGTDSFTAASLASGFYTVGATAAFTQGTDTFTPATHGTDSHTHVPPTLATAVTITGVQATTTTASHVKSGGNGSAPTLGTAITVTAVSGNTDVTVPIKATSATTVPIKNTATTTVVTSKTHTVNDSGHAHAY